jgi:hypothetical protein
MKYRNLRNRKHQTMEPYAVQTNIHPDHNLNTSFISLTTDGMLIISEHYAWDGASGPAIDTKDILRASAVHGKNHDKSTD